MDYTLYIRGAEGFNSKSFCSLDTCMYLYTVCIVIVIVAFAYVHNFISP